MTREELDAFEKDVLKAISDTMTRFQEEMGEGTGDDLRAITRFSAGAAFAYGSVVASVIDLFKKEREKM